MTMLLALGMGMQAAGQKQGQKAQQELVDTTAQDALVLIDSTGNEWIWYGIEDYDVGDIVAAIMDDNGTEIIYDDAIITMRYTGYAEGWE